MPDDITLSVLPNNRDAAFKKRTKKQKPTDLLLHYNYGAVAVKWWGQGLDILQKRSHPPRPPVSVQAKAELSRTRHDSTVTIDELDAMRGDGVGAGGVGTSGDEPDFWLIWKSDTCWNWTSNILTFCM